MGCWDIFCFLCGNTCHNTGAFYIEDYFYQNIKSYESKNKRNLSKFKSKFKPLYDKYNENPELFINKFNTIKKILNG